MQLLTEKTGVMAKKIIPLDYREAQKWTEENLSGSEFENIFGEVVEDKSRKTIHISITVAAHEKNKAVGREKRYYCFGSFGRFYKHLIKQKTPLN